MNVPEGEGNGYEREGERGSRYLPRRTTATAGRVCLCFANQSACHEFDGEEISRGGAYAGQHDKRVGGS